VTVQEIPIERIQDKARSWQAQGKSWHIHMLTPSCVHNKRPDKHAFVLENTTDGEAFVIYSEEPQVEADHALLLLSYGDQILDEDLGQMDPGTEAIQPVLLRAQELNERLVPWHHHLFYPGCIFNPYEDRWILSFEDPEMEQVTDIVYNEEPIADLRKVELLFFEQASLQP
jgi:hypothetical protein